MKILLFYLVLFVLFLGVPLFIGVVKFMAWWHIAFGSCAGTP